MGAQVPYTRSQIVFGRSLVVGCQAGETFGYSHIPRSNTFAWHFKTIWRSGQIPKGTAAVVLSICLFLQLVWSAVGAPSCGFQSMGWTVGTTPQQCSHADSTPRDAHMLTSSYAHIHISSYPQPQPASQPAGRPASQPGSIGRQVRFWGCKSANVRNIW